MDLLLLVKNDFSLGPNFPSRQWEFGWDENGLPLSCVGDKPVEGYLGPLGSQISFTVHNYS